MSRINPSATNNRDATANPVASSAVGSLSTRPVLAKSRIIGMPKINEMPPKTNEKEEKKNSGRLFFTRVIIERKIFQPSI